MNRLLATLAAAAAASTLLPACVPLAVVGAGTTAVVAGDRRTTGTYIEDESIELKSLGVLEPFKTAHVNVTSYNRRVLLTGEAPSEEAKKQIEDAVKRVDNVKEVVNELQVAGVSSYASRGSDSLVTSNVKARMAGNYSKFSALHVKVVTEAGTVYLMGLLKREEADAAVEVARTTSGVVRVVKVFEYIP